MEIVEKSPEKLVLRMNANYSLANAIRRSIEEIPTLAIDEVEFYKNDSALYDEFVAHRMGLIPLKTDGKMGASTSIDLKIKKSGPGLAYSGDLEGNAKVVFDKIPITLLQKGQELELTATAKMGTGFEHAKYVPGLCYYRYLSEVKSAPKIDEIVEKSRGLIKPEKKGNKWVCDLNEAEVNIIEKIDPEAVKESEELILIIDSWGQMDSEVILKKAIEVIRNNLEEFKKSID